MLAGPYFSIASGADTSLLGFPWAAAGTRPFRSWRPSVSQALAVSVARLGGREDRLADPPPADWAALVTELTEGLPGIGPCGFFRHCLGAIVAYEVALERRRRGLALRAALLLISSPPVSDGGCLGRRRDRLHTQVPCDGGPDPRMSRRVRALWAGGPSGPRSGRRLRAAGRAAAAGEDHRVPTVDAPTEERTTADGWAAETSERLRVIAIRGESLYPHGAWPPLGAAVAEAASAALTLHAETKP